MCGFVLFTHKKMLSQIHPAKNLTSILLCFLKDHLIVYLQGKNQTDRFFNSDIIRYRKLLWMKNAYKIDLQLQNMVNYYLTMIIGRREASVLDLESPLKLWLRHGKNLADIGATLKIHSDNSFDERKSNSCRFR